jgi:hypothetical protein
MEISFPVDQTLLWGLIGVVLTVVTFLITYIKTTGASEERRKTAIRECITVTFKTLVNEQVRADTSVLRDIVNSKAREHEVDIKEMPTIPMILEDVTTRLMENDFVPRDVKLSVMKTLSDLKEQTTERKPSEDLAFSAPRQLRIDALRDLASSLVASLSVASILSVFGGERFIPAVPAAVGVALVYYTLGYREKARQRKEKIASVGPAYESMIFSALKNLGLAVESTTDVGDKGFDLQLETTNGTIVLIEAKLVDYIGATTIRQFAGAIDAASRSGRKVYGVIITSGEATDQAKKVAKQLNIRLLENVRTERDLTITRLLGP